MMVTNKLSCVAFRNELRHNFTHEILLECNNSVFKITEPPSRRVSLIMRSQPDNIVKTT